MRTSTITIEQRLRELVLDITGLDPEELTNDSELSGDIDSLGVAEVVVELSSITGREITPLDLRGDDIRTISAMAAWTRAHTPSI